MATARAGDGEGAGSRRDEEVGVARAVARDDGARAERAQEPARAHGHSQDGEAAHQAGGADHIVGVALPRRVLEAAQGATHEGQQDELGEALRSGQHQHAHEGGGDRLARAGGGEQAMAREAVRDHAGRHAHEEQRQGARAHRGADQEGRVGQLEREPAEHDDLAHHSDGVQQRAHAEVA
jgi:hypothetical protein